MAAPRIPYYSSLSPEMKAVLHFSHINLLYQRIYTHAMPAYTRILLAQKEEKREGEKEGKIDPNFIILQLNDSIFSLAERIRNAWLPSKKFNILLANLAKTLEGDDQARQEAITNINDLLAEKDQELKK
ncbi:MAG: hypothetical protein K0S63_502, partial [Gammaproteobacteria bacterium]|nr:hypothetical protein [Gammaproteobacteria bacterium]